MNHRVPRWMLWLGVGMLAVILLSPVAQGQQRGQYIPGTTGLNSGFQAPPGFTYANYFIWYPSTTLKNNNGDKLPVNVDLDLILDFNVFAYTTKKKILGANYGFAVAVPIVSTAIDLPVVGAGIAPWGLGDIYVEPFNLGWTTKGQTRVKAAYGFVAPTGRFGAPSETTTTDMWGHFVTFATTHPFTKTKLWQVSASSVWEFHQTKRHSDLKVGNNVTFEGGVGKTWVKNQGKQLIQFGGVGYAEFQLTNDSGSAAPPPALRFKDRVFAIGPEFGVIMPQKKFNCLVRVLPEFGARSRTQGLTFVAGLSKSF